MNVRNNLLGGVAAPPEVPQRGIIGDAAQQKPRQPPPNIMISIPSTRTWEARTAACVAGISTFTAMHGYSISITNVETSMVTKGRNDIVEQAMRCGADYVMWIDSDMVMPPDTVLRLLKHNKDIVGATYNKRVAPYETLGRLKGVKPEGVMHGLWEAEQMPGGCMLVRTDVYRKLGWPWYWETYRWPGENGVDALKEYLRHNFGRHAPEDLLAQLDDAPIARWLNDVRAEEGAAGVPWLYYSEDLNFVRKAIKSGYRVWCDMDLTYQMVHLGTLEVTCKAPEKPAPVVDAAM